jgi:hypothetical protein
MKHILILATLLLEFGLHAQSIYFDFTNGTTEAYNIEDVRKIAFEADVMNLQFWDGSVYSWNVSTIGYYQYNQELVGVNGALAAANTWQVSIFPNPAQSLLQVRFVLPKAEVIGLSIYDLQGKMLLETEPLNFTKGDQLELLDISLLPVGHYICRLNGQMGATTKQFFKQ